MKLALKIDVDTLRGTVEGVPRLARLLERHGAGASFFYSLGPDHTGRALRRVFRPGFFSKVRRTSVLRHYGLRTLLYGTLLPGPDIGIRCAATLRAVRDMGFEAGVHCWDHVRWQDGIERADAGWTEREMRRGCERFAAVFGTQPRAWAAAGWQTNRHAARVEELAFDYASDTRGRCAFRPLWDGAAIGCAQLPTTLPTLDELVGRDGLDEGNVAVHLLALTAEPRQHVFTAHAELEGGAFLGAFEGLLSGWKAQGYELVSLRALFASLDPARLPQHDVVYGEIAGRSGRLALQA
ncbi:MAG TPA: 4-deoxy-4-formamido-L-arabinose-phosphoundecaprenol deformylase [Burkholderiales bacterium]|nr:4-deoxy-4-formamido-L-arabinose-phosphoundecaprenol deformylase [Burkholderiales bacterium]